MQAESFQQKLQNKPVGQDETDLIGSKLKIVKSRCYETYNTKETKMKHKEEAKSDEETVAADGEKEAPVPLVTHVNILH